MTGEYQLPGMEYDFRVRNPPADQGGTPGCGAPAYATGGIMTVTVVSPTNAGYVRFWTWNTPEPTTTTHFVYPASGATSGSTVMVPFSASAFPMDVSGRLTGGGHVVVDLDGYFVSSTTSHSAGVVTSAATTCPAGRGEPCWRDLSLSSGAAVVCQSPYIDVNACEAFQVSSCINVAGQIGSHLGQMVLFAQTVTTTSCG
jgi:hypothetical protein